MRYLLVLLLFISVYGCRNFSAKDLPPGLTGDSIIPEKEMIRMMAEVHVIETGIQMERNKNKETKPLQQFYYNQLFSHYKTSETRFRNNLLYYQANPDKFKKMYDDVVTSIDSMRKSVKP